MKRREVTAAEFARLFGTTVEDIPEECLGLIAGMDLRYTPLSSREREETIKRVQKNIQSSSFSVSGPDRQTAWEKGWAENLQNYVDSNYDLKELIPKFVKRKELMRLIDNYVMPESPDFETSLVTVLRLYLFKKYFSNVPVIYEFGCGTGLNLAALARLFPEKKLYGLDWSKTSCEIVNKIAETQKLNLTGIFFDMFHPDYRLDVPEGSAVFTIGAMEQLGKDFRPFLDFLLDKKFSICINIETLYELYDRTRPFDRAAAEYLLKRGYLYGYITRLRELEKEGKINIIKTQKSFGSLYHDGYSHVIWKPKS